MGMYSGICFQLHGSMVCGALRDLLIVRVGPQAYSEALALSHVPTCGLTLRPMTGWEIVAPEGWVDADEIAGWVERSVGHARSLPRKGVIT